MTRYALFLALLMAAPAQACDIWMPPPQYATMPRIMPKLVVVNFYEVDPLCRQMGVPSQGRMISCTSREFGTIVIPRSGEAGVTTEDQACYLRHELGHASGWPAEHPGAL